MPSLTTPMPQPSGCGSAIDAVDVGIGRQAISAEMVGDGAHHGGRAVDRGNHRNVVARADLAVRAFVAHEGGRVLHLGQLANALPNAVVALELAHAQVVRMDVLPRADVGRGKADDLVVAAHGVARLDWRAPPACGPVAPGRPPPGFQRQASCRATTVGWRSARRHWRANE